MLNNNKIRISIIIIGFSSIALLLLSRLFYLQIIRYDYFKQKATHQLKRIIKISPDRGYIYDRNKTVLAMTEYSYSIYAMPRFIKDKETFIKKISPIIHKSPKEIRNRINNDLWFIWLSRKKDKAIYDKLEALKIEGLDYIKEEKRIYPNNELASQVVGFVGIDNQGLGGFEFQYNEFLTGSPGKIILESDPRGTRIITGQNRIVEPTYDGWHLYTTLDSHIQNICEKYLEEAIQEQSALCGNVIVMNPMSGEILAMANYPKFNPNTWYQYPLENRKNRCVTDMYEPGSVFKIVTLSSALEEKVITPESMVEVPEFLTIQNRTIKEAHGRAQGESSYKKAEEIFIKSLNVGTSILATKLGKDKFYEYIENFGIGSKTQIECPGESPGMLKPKEYVTDLDNAMMSFGQGIAVTPLQIITIASVIANGGELLKPLAINYLIDKKGLNMQAIPKQVKRRVISQKTAKEMTDMMVKVVEIGTAPGAKIKGYTVAGKTGTAQIPNGANGYFSDKYVASFVGFLPAYNPKIVILVVIDSPQKSIWGATVAVPVFKKIALDLIDYMNIPPDQLSTKNNITTIERVY